ncbi:MAG: thermostable hemolysin [Alcanivorax sp.]
MKGFKMKLSYQENNINTANLYLSAARVSRISPLTPSVVSITNLFTPERQRVEAFIQDIYKNSYEAEILVDYPILMSVRNDENDILAAVGFRYAGHEPLFLEQYTKKPIENCLETKRNKIVEIGNLASAGQGASIFLFAALASYLNYQKIEFAAITGTDFLHRYFKRIGLNPQKICDADISSINQSGQSWGSYYDTQPRVLAGSVPHGIKKLHRALGAEFESNIPPLYSRLHHKGENV